MKVAQWGGGLTKYPMPNFCLPKNTGLISEFKIAGPEQLDYLAYRGFETPPRCKHLPDE